MLFKILSTVFSKLLTAGIGFIVVILTARMLGASVRGDIALLLLDISIIGLFQGVFNGSALIYLTPKFQFTKLFFLTNLCSLILASILPFIMVVCQILEANQLIPIIVLSALQGLLTTSQSLLLGKDRIQLFNLSEIIKSSVLLLALLIFFGSINAISFTSVMYSYGISYIIPFLITLIQLTPYFGTSNTQNDEHRSMIKSFFKYGFEIQVNNISHMINYRFCFYIIEKWKGKDALGIFSIALALCEVVWIIAKSIATFQYSKIVNSTDAEKQRILTIQSLQLSFVATVPPLLILIFLPNSVFTFVFGAEFQSIHHVLVSLAFGVIFLSIFTIINHYFSGIGKNKPNIIGSFIGNIVVIILCFAFIPFYGNFGAGLATSITYLVILIYIVARFLNHSNSKIVELIPTRSNLKSLIQSLKS